MDNSRIKDYINAHPEAHLQRDRSGKGYVCPLCNNGSGEDGTGLRLDPHDVFSTHYKCFKCGFYGDMIELIAQERGLKGDSYEAFVAAKEAWNITEEFTPPEDKPAKPAPPPVASGLSDEDVAAYLSKCKDHIEQGREYLKSRGLRLSVAAEAGVGYDPDKQAVVIPNFTWETGQGYTLRYTNPQMKIRYQNASGRAVGFFNVAALKNSMDKAIFVTEGAFDALSIIQVGYRAIALNSGDNIPKFIDFLREYRQRCPGDYYGTFYISMDNDEAGERFSQALAEGLKTINPEGGYEIVNVCEGYKDVNELMTVDPRKLRANLNRAIRPLEAQAVDAHKVGSLMAGFKAYISDAEANRSIPTGFAQFDKAIGGGLFPRLYVFGAVTSLGKTTLVLQIADQLAQQGQDVIIFSLEMPKESIISRSISRHSYLVAKGRNNLRLAKTELGIESYERYKGYSEDEKDVIRDAYDAYVAYATDHISIYEGKHTAAQIRAEVDDYIRYTGRRPVCIVDYLQLVQPSAGLRRATVREQVDDAVDTFVAMRRELKIPVIVISSFNRNSYNSVADNSSFKESGTIEYSSDCVITLELDVQHKYNSGSGGATNKEKTDSLEAMRGDNGIRDIKLTFQKNRGNRVGSVIYFKYDARFNHFEEDPDKQAIL